MTWLAVTGYLWQQICSVFHNPVLPSTFRNLLENWFFIGCLTRVSKLFHVWNINFLPFHSARLHRPFLIVRVVRPLGFYVMHENDVRFVFTPVGCRRAHFLFMLIVFVYVWWCASRIDDMSNMVGILWERWYTYLSLHLGLPQFLVGSMLLIFLVFCAMFFLHCLSLSCVLCTQCCQWLCIVHSWFPIRFSLTYICWQLFVFLLICP